MFPLVDSGKGVDHYTFLLSCRRSARERCWDEGLPASLLSDGQRGEVRPLPSLREDPLWQGKISRIEGGWQLQGRLCLQLQRECSRCLGRFWWSLQVVVEREFLFEADDDPLVSVNGEVDLIDVLREETWLSWQQFVPCSAGCQGVGGQVRVPADVNDDNPFAALSQLKFDDVED